MSYCFLPLATAISIFALPFLKYIFVGINEKPSSFILFGLVATAIASSVTLWIQPWGYAAFEEEKIRVLKTQTAKTIEPLAFNDKIAFTCSPIDFIDSFTYWLGSDSLNNLADYSFSQGTVVRKKKVIAVEGSGGTEKMLKKCRNKTLKNCGVLVKFPKKKQDLRVDLPTVGLNTLKQCKLASLKGIVLKNKQNIFLQKKTCINFANKNKMFIEVKWVKYLY